MILQLNKAIVMLMFTVIFANGHIFGFSPVPANEWHGFLIQRYGC
jgi:hypothetical protein